MINKALMNAGRGIRRKRVRPTWRDSHGGRSDEFMSRACIACRHYAIELITYNPPTRQEMRGIDASFTVQRVHSTYKGYETGGDYVSREKTTLRSIRGPYPRPLVTLSQRFRSCTGASVLPKSLGSCTGVTPPQPSRAWPGPAAGVLYSTPALIAALAPSGGAGVTRRAQFWCVGFCWVRSCNWCRETTMRGLGYGLVIGHGGVMSEPAEGSSDAPSSLSGERSALIYAQ